MNKQDINISHCYTFTLIILSWLTSAGFSAVLKPSKSTSDVSVSAACVSCIFVFLSHSVVSSMVNVGPSRLEAQQRDLGADMSKDLCASLHTDDCIAMWKHVNTQVLFVVLYSRRCTRTVRLAVCYGSYWLAGKTSQDLYPSVASVTPSVASVHLVTRLLSMSHGQCCTYSIGDEVVRGMTASLRVAKQATRLAGDEDKALALVAATARGRM